MKNLKILLQQKISSSLQELGLMPVSDRHANVWSIVNFLLGRLQAMSHNLKERRVGLQRSVNSERVVSGFGIEYVVRIEPVATRLELSSIKTKLSAAPKKVFFLEKV